MDLTAFSHTVDCIYDAALEPRLWPQALQAVADVHSGVRAFLYTPLSTPEQGGYVLTHDPVQVAEIQRWSARYGAMDPWVEAALSKGLAVEGNPILSQDLVPDAVMIRHPFYTEFLQHHNARHLCTGLVFQGRDPDLPTLVCGVHRGVNDPLFDEDNRQVHGLLLRHLSRAVGVMTRLRTAEMAQTASLAALDALPGPVLLLGRRAQVVFANRAAMAALARADGLALQASLVAGNGLGRLVADEADHTRAIEAEVAAALDPDPLAVRHFGPGLVLPQPQAGGKWVLRMAPLADKGRAVLSVDDAQVMVFLHDSAAEWVLPPETLQQVYGLTAAETRVAQALLQHGAPAEVARALFVEESTVRTQLKALFDKTGTNRQADLIKMLMGLARQVGAGRGDL